jgi:hypothetical protein
VCCSKLIRPVHARSPWQRILKIRSLESEKWKVRPGKWKYRQEPWLPWTVRFSGLYFSGARLLHTARAVRRDSQPLIWATAASKGQALMMEGTCIHSHPSNQSATDSPQCDCFIGSFPSRWKPMPESLDHGSSRSLSIACLTPIHPKALLHGHPPKVIFIVPQMVDKSTP